MKKLLLLLLPLILLAGCSGRALEEQSTGNPDFRVEKLFTVDGCTVYRFRDILARYFVNCSGGVEWEEVSGKNIQRTTSVPTSITHSRNESRT